ncbi:putative peptide methionine sulfoxide reductase [Candidatus Aquiluna sp. IMCC13023]|nr:putative peptide methionine sulfoxide reductase [Candidatus Aquiluna sp. IMCC13023]
MNVTFDPDEISSEQILDIFFTLHDPTQLNRQGADVGDQYRSAMFYTSESQKEVFTDAVERAKDIWGPNVVTEVTPLGENFEAEDYHQDYFDKNPNQGYCLAVVAPKVSKVRAKFTSLLR